RRAWPTSARRASRRTREDQLDPPGDHRPGHLAVGDQGLDRRGQGRRDPHRDAARNGTAGRSRARAPGKGDQRRGRIPGLGAVEGRGDRDRRPSDRAPAPLPADAARAGRVAVDHDRVPDTDRPDQALPREEQRRVELKQNPAGELRQEPITRPRVGVAPGRAQRPGASAPAGPDLPPPDGPLSCPFCEGREDRTPPETFAIRPGGSQPDKPGWKVRVVPNLYPVFEHHEVVVSTPRHVRSFGELDEEEVAAVASAWRERSRAAREAGFPYVHALLNEGREAGASLPHSHTQLVWLDATPPAVEAETGDDRAVGGHIRAEVESGERLVLERDGLAVLAAYGGRPPDELLIAPTAPPGGRAFVSDLLASPPGLLAESLRRIHALEGPAPLNAWLHDRGHWHVEVLPRLSVLAGIELGAGIYVNSLAPEAAAAALREVEI